MDRHEGDIWEASGSIWKHLEAPGRHQAASGHIWRHLGSTWEACGKHLGGIWEASGSTWEAFGKHLGASGKHLESPGRYLGGTWEASGHLGAIWGPSEGLVGDFMGAFWQFKNILGKSHPQPLTIQPQVFILQPGLAECAKPLKYNHD